MSLSPTNLAASPPSLAAEPRSTRATTGGPTRPSRAGMLARHSKSAVAAVLILVSVLIWSVMFTRGAFLDEADNMLGSCLMSRGQTIYVDFVSNHHPFHFYLLKVPYDLFGCDLVSNRYLNIAAIVGAFLVAFFVSRNLACLVAMIVYLLLAPRYRGYFYLSEGFQAVGMYLLLTLTFAPRTFARTYLHFGIHTLGQLLVLNSSVLGVGLGIVFPIFMFIQHRKHAALIFSPYFIALAVSVIPLLVDSNWDEFLYQGIIFQSQIYSKYLDSNPANPIHILLTVYRHTLLRIDSVLKLPWGDGAQFGLAMYRFDTFRNLIELVFLASSFLFLLLARVGILPTLFLAGVVCLSLNRPIEHRALPFLAVALFLLTLAPGSRLWQRVKLVPLGAALLISSWLYYLHLPSQILVWGDEYAAHRDRYVEALTEPHDRVLFVPGDARFYLVNRRDPGSFYQYFMPWTSEVPGAAERVIADIERNQVKLIRFDSEIRIWGAPPVGEYAASVYRHVLANYEPIDRPQDGPPQYFLRRTGEAAPVPRQPGARVYHLGSQPVPNDTPTLLKFEKERFDTGTVHDGDASRLTAPVAGTYAIMGNVAFSQGGPGTRRLSILLNGQDQIASKSVSAPADARINLAASVVRHLEAGEYVEAQVAQVSGDVLEVVKSPGSSTEFVPELAMVRLDDATAVDARPGNGDLAALLAREPADGVRVVSGDRQRIDADKTVALSFEAEEYDRADRHDLERQESRLNARRPGRYLVVGNVTFAADADGWRDAALRLNGQQTIAFDGTPATASGVTNLRVATIVDLGMLDYVELAVRQSSGRRLAIPAGSEAPTDLTMIRLSD